MCTSGGIFQLPSRSRLLTRACSKAATWCPLKLSLRVPQQPLPAVHSNRNAAIAHPNTHDPSQQLPPHHSRHINSHSTHSALIRHSSSSPHSPVSSSCRVLLAILFHQVYNRERNASPLAPQHIDRSRQVLARGRLGLRRRPARQRRVRCRRWRRGTGGCGVGFRLCLGPLDEGGRGAAAESLGGGRGCGQGRARWMGVVG